MATGEDGARGRIGLVPVLIAVLARVFTNESDRSPAASLRISPYLRSQVLSPQRPFSSPRPGTALAVRGLGLGLVVGASLLALAAGVVTAKLRTESWLRL
jgi:hypothetical protein